MHSQQFIFVRGLHALETKTNINTHTVILDILNLVVPNRGQIFSDQGLATSDLSEKKANELAQKILEQNRLDYGHNYDERLSTVDPLLRKYYYIKDKGTDKIRHEKNKEIVSLSTGSTKLDGTAELKNGAWVSIEEVDRVYRAATQEHKVLVSAKTSLQTELSKLEDNLARFKHLGPAYATKQAESLKIKIELADFLTSLRDQVAVGDALETNSPEADLEAAFKNFLAFKNAAMAHKENVAAKNRSYRQLQ